MCQVREYKRKEGEGMKFKIVADSAADIPVVSGVPFESVPLKIVTDVKEYVDDAALDVAEMVEDLLKYKGKSGTACPGPGEWVTSFGDAKYVFCVTITSNLSGSYNSACVAKEQYEREHPDRKVHIVDSLSAGAEMYMIVEKLQELILAGKAFEEICTEIAAYADNVHLIFSLESLQNLANNGRVNPAVAKIAGVLGIRQVGIASDVGTLQPMYKSRGEKKALADILKIMKDLGYAGGQVLIHHCLNENAAKTLKAEIQKLYTNANIRIGKTTGLCSFYAEKGGLMIGFETAKA